MRQRLALFAAALLTTVLLVGLWLQLGPPSTGTHNGFRAETVWYSDEVGACPGALRGRYAAHLSLPCGTRLRLRYNGNRTTVTVRDRGPYGDADLDICRRCFRALAPLGAGRIDVRARVLHD